MSMTDKMVPLLSAPWCNGAGVPLPVTVLRGLRSEVIQGLEYSYPATLTADMPQLLEASCGLTHTALGIIDFTGQWYPEEPLMVFRTSLSLARDDEGRRWIAETACEVGLPGPVWCIFPKPEVAVCVSDDLASFLATLRDHTSHASTTVWLQELTAEARAIWARRRALAFRSQNAVRCDTTVRGWLSALPFDAYVYDLRSPAPARGWPYGLAGPSSRLYRCGQLPIFAVAGRSASGRWAEHLSEIAATFPLARPAIAAASGRATLSTLRQTPPGSMIAPGRERADTQPLRW